MGTPGSLGRDPFGLSGLLELARSALGVDPASQGDDTLMAAVVALEDLRGLVDSTEALVLARLEATAATDVAVGMRTGRWLAWEADTGKIKCAARVTTARRLGWFRRFTEALTEGRVTYAHGELLASVANIRNRDALSQTEQMLIELAVSYPFDEWAQVVRQLALDLDSDGSYDPNEDRDANRVKVRHHGDGTVDLDARLVGDAAVTVTQSVERVADELFHRYRNDAKVDPTALMPARATLMAEAIVEICRRAMAVDLESTQRPGVEAVIVIDAEHIDDLFSDDGSPEGRASQRCRDLNGRTVAPSAAKALLVDAVVCGLVIDGDGVPLNLGRKVRFATPDQRLALGSRDGGCIFPGCDMPPSWCDAHHQPGWHCGGETDIDKMFLTCRHHHGVTHRKGWTCRPDPDQPQEWIWTTPNGAQLHSQRNRGHPT